MQSFFDKKAVFVLFIVKSRKTIFTRKKVVLSAKKTLDNASKILYNIKV